MIAFPCVALLRNVHLILVYEKMTSSAIITEFLLSILVYDECCTHSVRYLPLVMNHILIKTPFLKQILLAIIGERIRVVDKSFCVERILTTNLGKIHCESLEICLNCRNQLNIWNVLFRLGFDVARICSRSFNLTKKNYFQFFLSFSALPRAVSYCPQ